jgi:very-short-patch-repair endonuclease|tara:strand:+ start:397 stop:654 length:258 start_codon:yes stop_codon:yes gene_type:complete
MSRYEKTIEIDGKQHRFAYGYDRPMQTYFWQLFQECDKKGWKTLIDEGGLIRRTGVEFVNAIRKLELQESVDKDHRVAALMDLPF